MELDNSATTKKIEEIILQRKARAAALREYEKSLRTEQSSLRRIWQRIDAAKRDFAKDASRDPRIADAISFCADACRSIDSITESAEKAARFAHERLPHFERKEFRVATAGGTQAGKSTTLQKIVGMDEEKDPTCPIVGGGSGESTTAARCRVVNVEEGERPHAVVRFFEPDEFVKKILSSYVARLREEGVPLPEIETIEDFEAFDPDAFDKENDALLRECFANKETPPQWYARFMSMRRKLDDYRNLIGSGEIEVPLDKAIEYAVYPSAKVALNHLPHKCVAVREVILYCRYPNPVVSRCEYVDLPGLGEIAPDVEKRYDESFDLTTDVVLFVGAYDTRPWQNEGAKMVDKLGKIVPGGQLDNFMLHFQNDFGVVPGLANKLRRAAVLNKGARTPVYAVIGRNPHIEVYRLPAGMDTPPENPSELLVPEPGKTGRIVVFGEGNDAQYMTETFVPFVCAHAASRLPLLDDALVEEVRKSRECVAAAHKAMMAELTSSLKALLSGLPAKGAQLSSDIQKRIRELRIAFGAIRSDLSKDYKKRKLLVPDDKAHTPEGVQGALLRDMDGAESGLLLTPNKEAMIRSIRQAKYQPTGLGGELERAIRLLRTTITERYATLEDIYSTLISKLIESIFSRLRDVDGEDVGRGVPFLPQGQGGEPLVNAWMALLEDAGCPTLRAAAADLTEVRIQFYVTVYPDIRKSVFARTDNQVYNEEFGGIEDEEEIYEQLRNLAHDWARDAGTCISERNAAREIVFSAVERFFDRTLFSPESEDELNVFVSHYWTKFDREKKIIAPSELLRDRLLPLLKEIEEMEAN